MTTPKNSPFKLHFLAGVTELRDVKPHMKREFGWMPNESRGRSWRRKRRAKKK